MKYIEALDLLKKCVEKGLIKSEGEKVFIYRNAGKNSPEGWYLEAIEDMAMELMNDEEGQNFLMKELKNL